MTTPTFEKISRDPAFQEMFARARRRQLPKDQTVLAEGEKPTCLYFIMSGTVAVRLANRQGRDVLLAYMHAGDFFGEMGLLPGTKGRSAMVQTVTDCAVLEVAYPLFVELAARHSSLWLELAGQLAARLRVTNRRLADIPVLPATERVWSVVSELARRAEAPAESAAIPIRITREDLGKLAGCSRELAGTVLRDLARMGRLALHGHRILIPPESLTEAAPAVD